MEQDKRLRREIANSNERRRMQSINAGFAGLRNLLPNHEGEKLSKAAILQQTSDYIYQLMQEKNKAMAYNSQLKRMMSTGDGTSSTGGNYSSPQSPATDPPTCMAKRRKTMDGALESADEGIGSMSPEHTAGGNNDELRSEVAELRREAMELRLALDRERRHRISLEEHIGILQQQQTLYPRKQEQERVQSNDDIETFHRVPTPGRIVQDETPRCYTVRNNLETIVEAIRHLEGDHLFSDDRNNSTPSSSPPSASPRAMEVCSSSTGSPNNSQTLVEVPLALTATLSSASCQALPLGTTYIVASAPATVPGTPTLKHHMLNSVSRTVEVVEDQPMNLEFRPGLSRSPSPFNNQASPSSSNCHPQQQLRPGVIVVKHS